MHNGVVDAWMIKTQAAQYRTSDETLAKRKQTETRQGQRQTETRYNSTTTCLRFDNEDGKKGVRWGSQKHGRVGTDL